MQDMKILVTGLTGQVARPIALDLAQRNEVWGIARFTNAALREQLEAGGVRCETVDLESGDFSSLPTDFDVVLHFAVSRGAKPDFDRDMRANAEAAGLLLGHTRPREAFFQRPRMQLEQMIVEVVEVKGFAFTRHALAWPPDFYTELAQACFAGRELLRRNFECDVLIRLVSWRLAFHDGNPQASEQKESFTR